MIKISHRINTIDELKKVSCNFGVEIDIRSDGSDLILNHEPYSKGELLEDWITSYDHEILILNVKEEGLEEEILKLIHKRKIKKFFFLDQSFPFLIKSINNGTKECAVRISEYESIHTVLNLCNKVDWVWIDFFNYFPLSIDDLNILKEANFKLCLVSPELQGHSAETEIPKLINFLGKNIYDIDAVCTKRLELWEI